MTKIALVPIDCAKKGFRFIYLGIKEKDGCEKCSMKKVCSNLEANNLYEIKSLSKIYHDCKLIEGKVRTVEVEVKPIKVALNSSYTAGTTITYKKEMCHNITCENFWLCNPDIVEKGKYSILEMGNSIKCKEGRKLKEALLEKKS